MNARQHAINSALSDACGIFRDIVDISTYKDYVLIMLFLKYVSDIWHDHRHEYQAKYGDHPELIEEMLKHGRFVLPAQADFYTLYEQRHLPGNGERIDKALHALEDANLGKLRDVFQHVSFNANTLGDELQKNSLLRRLLEAFARPELDLRPSLADQHDMAGNACEYLLDQFAAGASRRLSEHHTPPEVAALMAHLMDPKEGDDICDPACGDGSLLMQCGRVVRESSGSRKYALYGQEAIGGTWATAKMNLLLHGEDNHRIEWGDALRNPKLLDGNDLRHFDVVVAHPPALEKWGHESADSDPYGRFHRGVPPRTRSDYAFISHMIQTMKSHTGRMAVLMPHGVLFRGANEALIRQQLIEENLLDVVIGLPEKLLYGTSIATAVLVFRKTKLDDNVLFIDASQGYRDRKSRNHLGENDLRRILDTVKARKHVDKYAYLASRGDIAQNGYNLNISRYIQTFDDGTKIDLMAVRQEREQLAAQLSKLEQQFAACLRDLDL